MNKPIKINPDIHNKNTRKRNKAIKGVLAEMDRKLPNAFFDEAKESIDHLRGLLHSRLADNSGRYDDDIEEERRRLMMLLRKADILEYEEAPIRFLINPDHSVRTIENCKNIIDFLNEAVNLEEGEFSGPGATGFTSIMSQVTKALDYASAQIREERHQEKHNSQQ